MSGMSKSSSKAKKDWKQPTTEVVALLTKKIIEPNNRVPTAVIDMGIEYSSRQGLFYVLVSYKKVKYM